MRKNYIKKESEELKMELTITNAEITSLEETEKNEIDKEIDRIINQHKNNRYEVNRLVFESVAALTQSENYSNELNSQGILKRFWGGITGKNRKLQQKIDNGLARAQYASQRTLKKLAEQNLMSFELITAVNNKLNSSIIEVEQEINKIYGTLVIFFKQTRSDIIQLENRVNRLEKNVELLNWQNSIEYQMWNGIEYSELDTISKIACIVEDFYMITDGAWTTSDLLLLKTAMGTIGLECKEIVEYRDIIWGLHNNPEACEKVFKDKLSNKNLSAWETIVAAGVNWLNKLSDSENYVVSCMSDCMKLNGIEEDDEVITRSLLDNYMEKQLGIRKDAGITLYDFVIEILYNIEQLKFLPSKTQQERMKDAENEFLSGNHDDAFRHITDLAEEGCGRSMYLLGEYYRWGYGYCIGVDVDEEKGFEWQKKGADAGDVLAKLNTSYIYDYDSDERKKIQGEVIDKVKEMAESGDVLAQNEYAYVCDGEEKIYWLEKSANAGHWRSMYKLGEYYYNGKLVEQNNFAALKWFLRAADLGSADAMGYIGFMYDWGYALQKSKTEAVRWYKKGAEAGAYFSMTNYANGLYNAWGVKQDKEEAKKWYQKAAEHGYERAKKALEEKY